MNNAHAGFSSNHLIGKFSSLIHFGFHSFEPLDKYFFDRQILKENCVRYDFSNWLFHFTISLFLLCTLFMIIFSPFSFETSKFNFHLISAKRKICITNKHRRDVGRVFCKYFCSFDELFSGMGNC